MVRLFHNVNFDWLANRRIFIIVSILLMLAGMGSAVLRYARGQDPFNLGVDFKGGTVITAEFNHPVSAEDIRKRLADAGVSEAVIQPTLDKPNQMLIRLPLTGAHQMSQPQPAAPAQATPASPGGQTPAGQQAEVDPAATKVQQALVAMGPEVGAKILQRDAVGPVAGAALRNQAVAVTLLALVGILVFISLRFEWTYGAAAVIAVFHDVLVTLGMFSIFQWEINLTVIAALLTLVGFSVNDTIVTFDRVRENLRLHRRESLYKITNDSINQTLSRTIITSGLVFLSVIALALFGGEVLRPFSLALVIGIVFGTYSSIAIASPIMVWWQQRLERQTPRAAKAAESRATQGGKASGPGTARARAAASTRSQRAAR
ncbi:MAG: protein translocase subunit SecF [Pyrinomonadaceae bacterium]